MKSSGDRIGGREWARKPNGVPIPFPARGIVGGAFSANDFVEKKNMLTLSKDMMIGIAKVDEQHQELVDRINAVVSMGARSASKEETQRTIDLLSEYIILHFGDEELLQRQCNYPKYEWHKGQHQILQNECKKIEKEFAETGPSPKFTLDLTKSIINWIVTHIKSADVELGKYYNAQKAQKSTP